LALLLLAGVVVAMTVYLGRKNPPTSPTEAEKETAVATEEHRTAPVAEQKVSAPTTTATNAQPALPKTLPSSVATKSVPTVDELIRTLQDNSRPPKARASAARSLAKDS